METNVVKIIDKQIKTIKKDTSLLPQNKVYKIEALEELRLIVSRIELRVSLKFADIEKVAHEVEPDGDIPDEIIEAIKKNDIKAVKYYTVWMQWFMRTNILFKLKMFMEKHDSKFSS